MRRAGLSGVVFRLFNMVVLVATTPILVSSLGDAGFGIFVTITSLIAFLALSDLGVGSGLLTVLGGAVGRGNRELMARHVTSAFWILVTASMVVLAIGLAASVIIDIPRLLGAPAEEYVSAQLAFKVFVVGFAVGIPLSIGLRVQQAMQHGAEASLWMSMVTTLSAVSGAAAAWITSSVVTTMIVTMGATWGVSLFQTLRVWKQYPWILSYGLRFRLSYARELVASSGWLFLLQLTAVVAFQSDLLIVSSILGSEQAAVYNGALRLFGLVSLVTTALAAQFWPASAEALSVKDMHWVRSTHRRLSWQLPVLASAAGLLLIIFGQKIIKLWLGEDLVPPISLLIAMALWFTYTSYLTPYTQLLNGGGVLKPQAVLSVLMAATNLAASIYLTLIIGLAGPPLGSLLASGLVLLGPSVVLARRVLGRSEQLN